MSVKMILAAVFAAFLGSAHAAPVAQMHLPGKLFARMNTDKAFYSPGQYAHVTVGLDNQTGAAFSGRVHVNVYGRGQQVSDFDVAATLAAGQKQDITLTVPTNPSASWQGYMLYLQAWNGNNIVDEQGFALDVSADYWTYPRQCWITKTWDDWGGYTNPDLKVTPEEQIRNLNAWHCNSYQLYDHAYRWHQAYQSGPSYVNGDKLRQQRDLTERNITAAHKFGTGVFGYIPLYAANVGIDPTFPYDGTGVQLSWGVFPTDCAANSSGCGVSDLWHFDADIAYMNPNNVDWQNYWARMARDYVVNLGLDGVFIDTYGTWEAAEWDYFGNRIIMDTAYSSFLANVVPKLNTPVTLNPAGSYNEQDLVQSGYEAWHFTERWNNSSDIGDFGAFLTKARQVWGWSNRQPHNIGLDWDMGMNKGLMADQSCNFNGGSKVCYFNTPGVIYQEAVIAGTGAHHSWLVDGNQGDNSAIRAISNDDYPIGNMATWPADMIQKEWDYQNFVVAYEKLLRLNISASSVPDPTVTSGLADGAASTTAAAGKVWLVQNKRSGFTTLSLFNFQQLTSANFTDVNDNASSAVAPTVTGAITVKMYYDAGTTLGNLYYASPDIKGGVPFNLTYTTGSDTTGSFITFTLPSLSYWDFVWLEENVSSSDYGTP